jgi:DNA-binding CsgD family transcriptional regulator
MTDWKRIRAAKLISHEPIPLSALLHVATVFGLCQSEARLVGLLSDGYTIIESAHIMHMTENTVRTFLKRVYSKTYTHNQAQLVRVVYRAMMGIAA